MLIEYSDFQDQLSKEALDQAPGLVAEWLMRGSDEYHTFLAQYILGIPLENSLVLMATLSDAQFLTNNEVLLSSVSSFLKSTDKRLAQTAATFLLTCGGTLGKSFLQQALSNEELPHSELVKGIYELLG